MGCHRQAKKSKEEAAVGTLSNMVMMLRTQQCLQQYTQVQQLRSHTPSSNWVAAATAQPQQQHSNSRPELTGWCHPTPRCSLCAAAVCCFTCLSACRLQQRARLYEYELALLANLTPEKVDEATCLVPSLKVSRLNTLCCVCCRGNVHAAGFLQLHQWRVLLLLLLPMLYSCC